MANTGAVTLDGGSRSSALGLAKGQLVFIPGRFLAGTTYATGGNPITLPEGDEGLELVDVILTNPHDGARLWSVVDVQTAPKIKAYDGFLIEETAATDTSAITLRAIFVFQS